MKMMTEAWFEYGGVRSDAMGLRMLQMPARYTPIPRGIDEDVPGRDGYLWIPEGAYMPIDITLQCETTDDYNADAVRAWLIGGNEKWLRISDEPNRAYKAAVIDAAVLDNRFLRFDRKTISIPFRCQPHRYEYPESTAVAVVNNNVDNPGTADSLPRIAVTATGDWSITVNGALIEVTGGSAIIDSELRDCLDIDGALLANSRVTLTDFPVLRPGANSVTWSGAISNIAVYRRVRYI